MQSFMSTFWLLACLLEGAASTATPLEPGLTFLYSATISGSKPIDIGPGPLGNLSYGPITGGTFCGPRLNGTVLGVGGELNLIDAMGNFHPDVRETLKTHDGAYIQVSQKGSGPQPGGVGYVSQSFTTGSQEYYWLNKVVAVGVLTPLSETNVKLDVWQLGD